MSEIILMLKKPQNQSFKQKNSINIFEHIILQSS